MKKLLTVFMALCVMLTAVTAVTAFAGEAAPTVVNWSDHEAEAAKIEGQFANVAQTGLKMFVPAEFIVSVNGTSRLNSGLRSRLPSCPQGQAAERGKNGVGYRYQRPALPAVQRGCERRDDILLRLRYGKGQHRDVQFHPGQPGTLHRSVQADGCFHPAR